MARGYLAIDPGAGGALALFSASGDLVRVVDMPTITVKEAGKNRRRINTAHLARLIEEAAPCHIFIEKVGARPGEGTVSSFSFGRAFGVLEGIAASRAISTSFILPRLWKRGTQTPADKNGARQRACQLFPSHAVSFARVKDDGRAEAALLGFYGLQTHQLVPCHEVSL